MRCFVAVTVASSITDSMARELPGLQAAAERCGCKISWARPEGWHVTLKFLGEIDDERADAVRSRLRAVAPAHAPFVAEAVGVTTLPEHARVPTVIAVALREGDRLAHLAAGVDEALAAAGFEREQRRFRPHVTFARVRAPRGWRCFAQAISPLARKPFGAGTVADFALYRSHLGNGPANYEVLESFALGGAAERENDGGRGGEHAAVGAKDRDA